MSERSVASFEVRRVREAPAGMRGERREDAVAVERALQVRARFEDESQLVTTTMRTPGADEELAAGFLLAERVIETADELLAATCLDEDTVVVELAPAAGARLGAATRRFVTSSACGVCGRDDVDSMVPVRRTAGREEVGARAWTLAARTLAQLPAKMREAQATFAMTGGLHAAGLFDGGGNLQLLREDVGRHNAVDKVVGAHVLAGRVHLEDCLLLVSGRASFELVQKAAVARIPLLAAVGAPSSLAVTLAADADMTLLGFVRAEGFNVYHQSSRLRWEDLPP